MALREEFESSGNWLFRWRSYLPLLMLSLAVVALRNFKYVYYNGFFDKLWELACLVARKTPPFRVGILLSVRNEKKAANMPQLSPS